jgi:hypothetical protein
MCGGGEEKRKAEGVNGWWGKKKKWGVGYTCMVGKKGEWKKKEEKKIEREKTKLVLFVCSFYLVQSVEL